MPEIPIVSIPQMQRTANVGEHVSGDGWRSSQGNWQGAFNNGAGDTIRSLGNNAQQVGDSIFDFNSKLQEAEDNDAIQTARRTAVDMYEKFNVDIKNRVDFENFEKEQMELSKQVEKAIEPHLARASNRAKAKISADNLDMASASNIQTYAIATQHKVSTLKKSADEQMDWYVDRGMVKDAEKVLSAGVRSGIYHPGEAESYKKKFLARGEYNTIIKGVDGGQEGVMFKALQERNEDGSWKNFPNIDDGMRQSLHSYSEGRKNKIENELADDLERRRMEGTLTAPEVSALEQTGKIQKKTATYYLAGLNKDQAELGRFEAAQKFAENGAKVDEISMNLLNHTWSKNPAQVEKEFKGFHDQIMSLNGDNGTQTVLRQLNAARKEALGGKSDFDKSSPTYTEMKKILKSNYESGKFAVKTLDRAWYNPRNDVYTSPEEQQYRFTELAERMEDLFKADPEMSLEKGVKWMREEVQKLQKGTVKNFLKSSVGGGTLPLVAPKKEIKGTGTAPDGRKVTIYNDGSYVYAK